MSAVSEYFFFSIYAATGVILLYNMCGYRDCFVLFFVLCAAIGMFFFHNMNRYKGVLLLRYVRL